MLCISFAFACPGIIIGGIVGTRGIITVSISSCPSARSANRLDVAIPSGGESEILGLLV